MDNQQSNEWKRWKMGKTLTKYKYENVKFFVFWWWILKQTNYLINDVLILIVKLTILNYDQLQKRYHVNGLGEYLSHYTQNYKEYQKVKKTVWKQQKTKPTKFMGVLTHFSTTKDPLNSGEWKLLMKIGYSDLHGECICSQELNKRFFYINVNTNKIVVVGSECIKKFGNSNQIKDCKLIEKITKEGTNTRKVPCAGCGEFKQIDKNIFCFGCSRKGVKEISPKMIELLGYKGCSICKKKNIFMTSFKDKCLECFKIYKNTEISINNPNPTTKLVDIEFLKKGNIPSDSLPENKKDFTPIPINTFVAHEAEASQKNVFEPLIPLIETENRKCNSCNELKIPVNSPKWKKECVDCYLKDKKSKNVGHSRGITEIIASDFWPCCDCKELNIPKSSPKWKIRCLECHNKHK